MQPGEASTTGDAMPEACTAKPLEGCCTGLDAAESKIDVAAPIFPPARSAVVQYPSAAESTSDLSVGSTDDVTALEPPMPSASISPASAPVFLYAVFDTDDIALFEFTSKWSLTNVRQVLTDLLPACFYTDYRFFTVRGDKSLPESTSYKALLKLAEDCPPTFPELGSRVVRLRAVPCRYTRGSLYAHIQRFCEIAVRRSSTVFFSADAKLIECFNGFDTVGKKQRHHHQSEKASVNERETAEQLPSPKSADKTPRNTGPSTRRRRNRNTSRKESKQKARLESPVDSPFISELIVPSYEEEDLLNSEDCSAMLRTTLQPKKHQPSNTNGPNSIDLGGRRLIDVNCEDLLSSAFEALGRDGIPPSDDAQHVVVPDFSKLPTSDSVISLMTTPLDQAGKTKPLIISLDIQPPLLTSPESIGLFCSLTLVTLEEERLLIECSPFGFTVVEDQSNLMRSEVSGTKKSKINEKTISPKTSSHKLESRLRTFHTLHQLLKAYSPKYIAGVSAFLAPRSLEVPMPPVHMPIQKKLWCRPRNPAFAIIAPDGWEEHGTVREWNEEYQYALELPRIPSQISAYQDASSRHARFSRFIQKRETKGFVITRDELKPFYRKNTIIDEDPDDVFSASEATMMRERHLCRTISQFRAATAASGMEVRYGLLRPLPISEDCLESSDVEDSASSCDLSSSEDVNVEDMRIFVSRGAYIIAATKSGASPTSCTNPAPAGRQTSLASLERHHNVDPAAEAHQASRRSVLSDVRAMELAAALVPVVPVKQPEIYGDPAIEEDKLKDGERSSDLEKEPEQSIGYFLTGIVDCGGDRYFCQAVLIGLTSIDVCNKYVLGSASYAEEYMENKEVEDLLNRSLLMPLGLREHKVREISGRIINTRAPYDLKVTTNGGRRYLTDVGRAFPLDLNCFPEKERRLLHLGPAYLTEGVSKEEKDLRRTFVRRATQRSIRPECIERYLGYLKRVELDAQRRGETVNWDTFRLAGPAQSGFTYTPNKVTKQSDTESRECVLRSTDVTAYRSWFEKLTSLGLNFAVEHLSALTGLHVAPNATDDCSLRSHNHEMNLSEPSTIEDEKFETPRPRSLFVDAHGVSYLPGLEMMLASTPLDWASSTENITNICGFVSGRILAHAAAASAHSTLDSSDNSESDWSGDAPEGIKESLQTRFMLNDTLPPSTTESQTSPLTSAVERWTLLHAQSHNSGKDGACLLPSSRSNDLMLQLLGQKSIEPEVATELIQRELAANFFSQDLVAHFLSYDKLTSFATPRVTRTSLLPSNISPSLDTSSTKATESLTDLGITDAAAFGEAEKSEVSLVKRLSREQAEPLAHVDDFGTALRDVDAANITSANVKNKTDLESLGRFLSAFPPSVFAANSWNLLVDVVGTEEERNSWVLHLENIATFLRTVLLPHVACLLLCWRDTPELLSGETIRDVFHVNGVNMRYLGSVTDLVEAYLRDEQTHNGRFSAETTDSKQAFQFSIVEILDRETLVRSISRVFSRVLTAAKSEKEVQAVTAALLNMTIAGPQWNSNAYNVKSFDAEEENIYYLAGEQPVTVPAPDKFWIEAKNLCIHQFGRDVFEKIEKAFKRSTFRYSLVRGIARRVGLVLSPTALDHLLKGVDCSSKDVIGVQPRCLSTEILPLEARRLHHAGMISALLNMPDMACDSCSAALQVLVEVGLSWNRAMIPFYLSSAKSVASLGSYVSAARILYTLANLITRMEGGDDPLLIFVYSLLAEIHRDIALSPDAAIAYGWHQARLRSSRTNSAELNTDEGPGPVAPASVIFIELFHLSAAKRALKRAMDIARLYSTPASPLLLSLMGAATEVFLSMLGLSDLVMSNGSRSLGDLPMSGVTQEAFTLALKDLHNFLPGRIFNVYQIPRLMQDYIADLCNRGNYSVTTLMQLAAECSRRLEFAGFPRQALEMSRLQRRYAMTFLPKDHAEVKKLDARITTFAQIILLQMRHARSPFVSAAATHSVADINSLTNRVLLSVLAEENPDSTMLQELCRTVANAEERSL